MATKPKPALKKKPLFAGQKPHKEAPAEDTSKEGKPLAISPENAPVSPAGATGTPPAPQMPANAPETPPAGAEKGTPDASSVPSPAPQPETPPATPAPAPAKAPAHVHPTGPGLMTCIKGGGTKLEVLGRDTRYVGEVWCKVFGSGDPWHNHYKLEDIEDTDELWDFLGMPRPQREPTLTPEQDRHGVTFKDAVAQQKRELEALEFVLKPKHGLSLRAWCEKRNQATDPNATPRGTHRVPRGVELTNWLIKRVEFFKE